MLLYLTFLVILAIRIRSQELLSHRNFESGSTIFSVNQTFQIFFFKQTNLTQDALMFPQNWLFFICYLTRFLACLVGRLRGIVCRNFLFRSPVQKERIGSVRLINDPSSHIISPPKQWAGRSISYNSHVLNTLHHCNYSLSYIVYVKLAIENE